MIGTAVDGRDAIERALGAGAMGRVYEAVHRGTLRHVALKVILREQNRRSPAFGREVPTRG